MIPETLAKKLLYQLDSHKWTGAGDMYYCLQKFFETESIKSIKVGYTEKKLKILVLNIY